MKIIVAIYIICFLLLTPTFSIGQESNEYNNAGLSEYKLVDDGFFNIYVRDTNLYLAIPDSLLSRDIIIFSRVINTNNDQAKHAIKTGGHPGSMVMEEVIRFVKYDSSHLCLQLVNYGRHTTAHSSIIKLNDKRIDSSLINLKIIDISYYNKGNSCQYISLKSLVFLDDKPFFINYFSARNLSIDKEKETKVNRVTSDTESMEIVTTYSSRDGFILNLNTSLLLLSPDKMSPRVFDARINYFNLPIVSAKNGLRTELSKVITRWRLEPKPENMQEYLRGEIVEPKKQIVFLLDPTLPSKWAPYFIKGVEAWNQCMEAAGFKNAITAKYDTSANLFDAKVSAIHYFESYLEDGTFSSIVDPRSGEILQSHILMSNALEYWFYKNYYVLVSPSDTSVRGYKVPDSIIGKCMQRIITHEIGHALGFEHNKMASRSVPVELLRDKNWVEANGYCPSIMDYARFNYVAQQGDKVTGGYGLINSVGSFDKWAVNWGYRYYNQSAKRQKKILFRSIKNALADNSYIYLPEYENDRRIQEEDVGDDPNTASFYGINNLKYVMSDLKDIGVGLQKNKLQDVFNTVKGQFNFYIQHVTRHINKNCYYFTRQGAMKVKKLLKSEQLRAFNFVDSQLFNTPRWILDSALIRKMEIDSGTILNESYQQVIENLFSIKSLGNIIKNSQNSSSSLNTRDLFTIFRRRIWSELYTNSYISVYRMNLQQIYLKKIISLINPENKPSWTYYKFARQYNEMSDVIHFELNELYGDISEAIMKSTGSENKKYFQQVQLLLQPHFNANVIYRPR